MSVTRLTLSVYRPRPGREGELLPHLHEEIAALRARGHITARPAVICRAPDGAYLVVSEWASPTAVDDAHGDESIVEIWRRKDGLAEYLAPADLDGSAAPFASYDVIDDA